MRKVLWLAVLLLASSLATFPTEAQTASCVGRVSFLTPVIDMSCRDVLLSLISQAQSTIDAVLYSFTDGELAAALIEAHKRGVHVRVMLENQNANAPGSEACKLAQAGIPVKKEKKYGFALKSFHHKFIVVDGIWVVTGSANWSAANDENCENAVIFYGPTITEAFAFIFERYLWPNGYTIISHETWCPGCTCLERLNRATAEQFAMANGIWLDLAQWIVQYRDQIGGFKYPKQLVDVPDIGAHRLRWILQYFCPELFGGQPGCTDP